MISQFLSPDTATIWNQEYEFFDKKTNKINTNYCTFENPNKFNILGVLIKAIRPLSMTLFLYTRTVLRETMTF
jgi:hypothetical protein